MLTSLLLLQVRNTRQRFHSNDVYGLARGADKEAMLPETGC